MSLNHSYEIYRDDSGSTMFDIIEQLCSDINSHIKYPYEVFSWQLSGGEELSISNFLIMTKHLQNEQKLLATDKVARNRTDTEYIDIDGEECLVEITGEDGYFLEIEEVECEIDIQDISEENRLQEVKKQVYSHVYTFTAVCVSV